MQKSPMIGRLCVCCLLGLLSFSFLLGSCQCSTTIGTAGAIALDLSDGIVRFSTRPGAPPQRHSLLVYNEGNAPLTLSGASLSNNADGRFQILTKPDFPMSLEPGKEAGVVFELQVRTTGLKGLVSRLILLSPDASNRDGQGQFTVHLEHVVRQGELKFDCAGGLAFGELKPGKSRTRLCGIRNIGAAPFVLKSARYIHVYGAKRQFALSGISFPVTLSPRQAQGQGVTAQVKFQPNTKTFLRHRGRFVFDTDLLRPKGALPPSFSVTGILFAPLIDVMVVDNTCVIDADCHLVSPAFSCLRLTNKNEKRCIGYGANAEVHFYPSRYMNDSKLTLTNPGNGPLTLTDLKFIDTPPGIFYLSPLGTSAGDVIYPIYERNIELSMIQVVAKRTAGIFQITSDALNQNSVTVKVVANEPGCWLKANIPSAVGNAISIGTSPLGSTSTIVTLSNRGQNDCVIKRIAMRTKGAQQIQVKLGGSLPVVIKAGIQELKVTLTYTPDGSAKEPYVSTLEIESNHARSALVRFPVRAVSPRYRPCLKLSNALTFQYPVTVKRKCLPHGRTIEIVHTGATGCVPIKVTSLKWTPWSSKLFALEDLPPLPFQLKSGGSFRVKLEYLGLYQLRALYRGLLHIETDALMQPRFALTISAQLPQFFEHSDTHRQLSSSKSPFPKGYTKTFKLRVPFAKEGTSLNTIDVYVNNKPVFRRGMPPEQGVQWRYDAKEHSVTFEDQAIPPPNAVVVFRYSRLCAPENVPPPAP